MLRFALFDLDDTLYAPDCGLWPAIGERINTYMIERCGLSPAVVVMRRHEYLETFGSTLNGLRRDFDVDAADFLAYVHDLPLERYLQPDPALDAFLARLPLEKVVFTNADTAHAGRVLARLGLARHFTRVIDVVALDYVNKPDPRAYQRALAILGARPGECVFVDDALRNVRGAWAVGMPAFWVHPGPPSPDCPPECQLASLLDLEAALQRLGQPSA